MEKINIAKILKDCPQGTLLYATVHGEVKLSRITSSENYPIEVELDSGADLFTEDGRMYPNKGECVLFPSKDQRDWSKFQRPFKDGDIIFTLCDSGNAWISIFKKRGAFGLVETYADYAEDGGDFYSYGEALCNEEDIDIQRLATEEEKEELFKAIEFNGYRWNAVTKTLEKSIEKPNPKFKVGAKIQLKNGHSSDVSILKINADCYTVKDFMGDQITIDFTHQDNYELVPDKFDITTLKPFDKVLARDNDSQKWDAGLFSFYTNEPKDYRFQLVGFVNARYCIPYEGNEHLLGTTDDCSDYYKNW